MGTGAPKKLQKFNLGKKIGIGIGSIIGLILVIFLINELSWLPARLEVAEMAKQPIASKSLLGMKLRSAYELHAVPSGRSFLGKPRSAQVSRYFDMPAGETQESLLEKLKTTAEKDGWVITDIPYIDDTNNDHFRAKKSRGSNEMRLGVGVSPEDEYSPVYVSIEKP